MDCDAAEKPVAKRWYVLDVVLFGGFALAYVGFFAAIPLMDYLDGLRGGSKSFGSFVFCGLPVVMLVWLLVLPVRMLTGWPKHIQSRCRLVVLCLSVSVALPAWVALPFLGLWLPGCEPFMHGFRHHMRANTDLGAIRGWLITLDPNTCTGEYIDLYTGNDLKSRWPDSVAWPEAVTRFDPRSSNGDVYYEDGEYRLPLVPGAYVWHELQ